MACFFLDDRGYKIEANQQLADISRFLVMEQGGFAAWSNPLIWIDPKGILMITNRHGGTQEVQTGERMDE